MPPRLPERAAIYIAPDGTVHFGALFEGLVPVAEALRGGAEVVNKRGPPPSPEERRLGRSQFGVRIRSGFDTESGSDTESG